MIHACYSSLLSYPVTHYMQIQIFLCIILYLFLEAALLQQLVSLIQNKQSDAGGGQYAELDKLLDTTCVHNQEHSYLRNSSNSMMII